MNPWDLLPWAGAIAVSLLIITIPVTIFGLALRLIKQL
jgi:hypothetical protein